MRYQKNIDGVFSLTITDDLKATVTGEDVDQDHITVQLKDEDQAASMIREFEDIDGELINQEGSVFKSFPKLHVFIP